MNKERSRSIRRRVFAAAATIGAFAVAGPVSGAGAFTWPTWSAATGWGTAAAFTGVGAGGPAATQSGVNTSGCSTDAGGSVGGTTGGTSATPCSALLSFVGPAIGQVSSVVGPTIIGSTVVAPVTVASGNVVNSAG